MYKNLSVRCITNGNTTRVTPSRNVYLLYVYGKLWTGGMFEEGWGITVDAPLEKIPFYCREDTEIN